MATWLCRTQISGLNISENELLLVCNRCSWLIFSVPEQCDNFDQHVLHERQLTVVVPFPGLLDWEGLSAGKLADTHVYPLQEAMKRIERFCNQRIRLDIRRLLGNLPERLQVDPLDVCEDRCVKIGAIANLNGWLRTGIGRTADKNRPRGPGASRAKLPSLHDQQPAVESTAAAQDAAQSPALVPPAAAPPSRW
jgi:hypothetical protein